MKETLYIGHDIFLNRKQRYNLYNGKKVKVIGINTCCWMPQKLDCTEFFSEYVLIPKKRSECKIKNNKKGYIVYINNPNMLSILDFLYKKEDKSSICAKNLIDIVDGGKEWLFLKQEVTQINYNIVHTVEIKKIEDLTANI